MLEEPLNIEQNNEKLDLQVEVAQEDDWKEYERIRLEAIEKEPMALGVTKESKTKEYKKTEIDWEKDLIGDNTFIVLAKNKKQAVGMAHAIFNDRYDRWGVRGVYLNEKFRGKNLGRKIIELVLREIKKRGGKVVGLNVLDTQETAKALYEKLGFKVLSNFNPEIIDGIQYPGGCWMQREV